ncbi:MAG TPA: beta-glucosidase [Clostridiaceae bacterium]|nr:beta-glucosidase [Clostridiaceae bacterium]
MLRKSGLWRGLAAISVFLFGLSIIAGNVLESYSATIDTFLGTHSQVFQSESSESDPLYNKFLPSEEVLNPDGTGNSRALILKAIRLGREQAAEGSVLLKNDKSNGGGLPLKEGAAITLFGIRSSTPIVGSAFGVKAHGPYINLEQALSSDKTDFAHTMTANYSTSEGRRVNTTKKWTGEEFEFDGAGFTINPTMSGVYKILSATYQLAENDLVSETYNPYEPSVSEIENVNPNFRDSFTQYNDAAIVVISRPSGESTDFLPGGVEPGIGAKEPLALTTNEKDAIKLAKECSDNVIVLLNTSSAIEIGELKNDPEIDAILWIGAPGNYGFLGVADILSGKVSPSGGLFDIFPTYNMSAPAMQNMGRFSYTNAKDVITRGGGRFGGDVGQYLMEAEGIYVGYRYYETRYYDCVMGQGNAKSSAGTFASEGAWDYAKEVAYSFGFGLSYTNFKFAFADEPVLKVSTNEKGIPSGTMTFKVKVTNTGNMAGKTSVQIYGQAPYLKGGVEKSAIQLLNFDKTRTLQPGESETVEIVADLQYIASYDSKHDNGDGTFGAYIMDPGKYYFAVGNGAHDALNNILALQGANPAVMVGEGNAEMAYEIEITEKEIPKTFFSVTKTGARVSNRLDYSDWNYFQEGEVTYLSRADWEATWPRTYDDLTLKNKQLIDYLNGHYYTIATNDNTSKIEWGKDNGILFYEMYGVDFDDEKWERLLSSMTLEEAMYLVTYGGPSIPAVPSIGIVEAYLTENAGNGIQVSLQANKDPNAPWAIKADDPNAEWHPGVFGNAPLVASTFNPDFMYRIGQFVGEESLFTGISILWGPGLNTHRHAYNGRNGEYYSEDPVLSGICAMEFAIGALDYGLIAAPKHFAFNDQETNRSGVAPYMTEQRAREIELRAYQYAVEASKYDTEEYDASMLGLMVSLSKIGPVECTASRELMTDILQTEWGFKGYAVTDIYDDTDIYAAVLTSGTTCYDMRGLSGFGTTVKLETDSNFASQIDGSVVNPAMFDGDLFAQMSIRSSAHKNLYVLSRSNLMNRYNSSTRIVKQMTWWRSAYYGAIIGTGAFTLIFLLLYLLSLKKNIKEGRLHV